jgi:hypothetical protein
MKQLQLAVLGAVLAAGSWAHAAPALPENQRLSPVRPALETVIADAERQSLPTAVLVSKVREGLAKGVPAEGILAAVRTLAQNLGKAERLVRASGRPNASPTLLRTLAEAQAAGTDMELARTMAQSSASDADLVRAVDVLTELGLRGYPRRQAAEVVQQVLLSDPAAMGRVVAGLEDLRSAGGLSRIDAVDSLGRSLTGTASLESALSLAIDTAPGNSGNAPGQSGGRGKAQGSTVGKKMKGGRGNR